VGVIFNASSVALPKLFEEGLTMMRSSTLGVGGLVSVVIAIAAFAQVGVGYLIDKFPIKPIWITIMLLQAPFLVLAGMTQNVVMVAVSLVMMILILGEVPIQDALIARYARESWRSRAYAVKFLLALSTAPLAVPIIALLHGATGNFSLLFIMMGGFAVAVAVVALWLPAPRSGGEPAPVPVGGGP
jgi:MFS family permease